MHIVYIDRESGLKKTEKVYKRNALQFLYGEHWFGKWISPAVLPLIAKLPFFSHFIGLLQKQPNSAKKIQAFINEFEVDENEFLDPVSSFQSFNDFFIRKLKPEVRPIAKGEGIAVIPADARYYFYQNIEEVDGFIVKDQKFSLQELLQSQELAEEFSGGSMVIARLCPTDYHRFHFCCEGVPKPAQLINGWLFSVNPIAIKKNISIFTENKRMLCEIDTTDFGHMVYMEIGATTVGSIQETYIPNIKQLRGGEKGFFEFGASALILLFKKGSIQFDSDLIAATKEGFEIRCLLGQSMGKRR